MQSQSLTSDWQPIAFGPFRLSVAMRRLEKDGEVVRIGDRALDILIALIESPGEILTQNEILSRVWPDTTVAESAIRVHINALRRVLGDGQNHAQYVKNVAGRGYCFIAPTSKPPITSSKTLAYEHVETEKREPARLPGTSRVFGRDPAIRMIAEDLWVHRFVTIIGPGGIGKTTVAVGVGRALATSFNENIALVDLGTISDAELVLPTIRAALKLPPHPDPIADLLEAIGENHLLLILDCCEHVIEAVAGLAERIFLGSTNCYFLATSREPLRIDGERLFHLSALDCPPASPAMTALDAQKYSAVQLFVERVAAIQRGFSLADEDVGLVGEICRRVDGIALAIELAAGRVGSYGLREVAAQLEDRIHLIWQGRRTAPARQQTLAAMLDWSCNLLKFSERMLLCRLSAFVGGFTLDAVRSVWADPDRDATEVPELLASLVEKSLVAADFSTHVPLYRLLDVTREYAQSNLVDNNETNEIARRHAEYHLTLLDMEIPDHARSTAVEHYYNSADAIANIRSALKWSFSDDGDRTTAVLLVSHAAQLFLARGLVTEANLWIELAIAKLDAASLGTRVELRLQTALFTSVQFMTVEQREAAFNRSIQIAKELDEERQRLNLLYFYLFDEVVGGDPEAALKAALEIKRKADQINDPVQSFISHAILTGIYKYIACEHEALHHATAADSLYTTMPLNLRSQIDDRLLARFRASAAVVKFLCGFPQQAGALATDLMETMKHSDNYINWCNLFASIAFVFKWLGDWEKIAQICELYDTKFRNQPESTQSWLFAAFRAEVCIANGQVQDGVAWFLKQLSDADLFPLLRFISYEPCVRGLVELQRYGDALSLISEALDDGAKRVVSVYRSELLLLKGQLLALMSNPDIVAAEDALRLALEAAKDQRSLSWELNAAAALASLLEGQDRLTEAVDILAPIYEQFTEGFDTKDVKLAHAILDRLRSSIYQSSHNNHSVASD